MAGIQEDDFDYQVIDTRRYSEIHSSRQHLEKNYNMPDKWFPQSKLIRNLYYDTNLQRFFDEIHFQYSRHMIKDNSAWQKVQNFLLFGCEKVI